MNSYIQTIQSLIPSLADYQIQRIYAQVLDFKEATELSSKFQLDCCPKCGVLHPQTIRGGTTLAGKQMLRCKECGKRFVVDHGQLTYYSHQSQAKWDVLIQHTLAGDSMKHIASISDVHESTAFRMRHKFLHAIESEGAPICTSRNHRVG